MSIQVQGYVVCPCGELVPEVTAWQTEGQCMRCFSSGQILSRMRSVEIAVRGGKTPIKLTRRRNHGQSKGRVETRYKVNRAKDRAMRRLRHLYPDMFDVLYAEERHKEGLPPVARRDYGHLVKAVGTYQGPRTYDAPTRDHPEP